MRYSFKILIFLFVFLVGAGFWAKNAYAPKTENPALTIEKIQEAPKEVTVNLSIDFGQGKVKNFSGVKTEEGKAVFDLLQSVTKENNLEFSFKEYPGLGPFIESIDGKKGAHGYFWQFWVNGQYSQVGASQYWLRDNDMIEWKYAKSQF